MVIGLTSDTADTILLSRKLPLHLHLGSNTYPSLHVPGLHPEEFRFCRPHAHQVCPPLAKLAKRKMEEARVERSRTITPDMKYEQRLLLHTHNTGRREPHFVIFRGLQRLNITRLQMELAQLKRVTERTQELPAAKSEELTRLLHAYSKTPSTTSSFADDLKMCQHL